MLLGACAGLGGRRGGLGGGEGGRGVRGRPGPGPPEGWVFEGRGVSAGVCMKACQGGGRCGARAQAGCSTTRAHVVCSGEGGKGGREGRERGQHGQGEGGRGAERGGKGHLQLIYGVANLYALAKLG